jgi:hypothetical protein
MSIVSLDTSPAGLLARFRGRVTNALVTYPERMILEVVDAAGAAWRISTWEAEYSPEDPDVLNGKTVAGAELDGETSVLTISFVDGSCSVVTPIHDNAVDAIENWQLFTPHGAVLSYGPRGRWDLTSADEVG